MAFNKTTVENYYAKLEEVKSRHSSFADGSSVYNLDETSTSTVQNTRKLVSPKGVKQVHQIQGAERGTSVTTAVIIGANGSFLPPVLIFPRKKFVSSLILNAYPGTIGLGNEKGYMTKESFVEVMKHFIKCTGSSKENPKLLLLDNVESHFSIETLDLARDKGVVVFTFPPHCTHRLQPLDVGFFFGPFKNYYDGAINSYYRRHPGQPTTIYHIAGFVKEAMSKISPGTIISSFDKTGIQPLNKHIFTDDDFAMAKVTEKPAPDNVPVNESNAEETAADVLLENENVDDPVVEVSASPNVDNAPLLLTPRKIRGYPKAVQKEKQRKPRRKGKCMVATDTPEKLEIEEREIQQKEKKALLEERKRKRQEQSSEKIIKQSKGKKGTKKVVVKKVLIYSSDSDDSESANNVPVINVPKTTSKVRRDKPAEGDYVLVVFVKGKKSIHFVGKVTKDCDKEGELEVSYLRHSEGGRFTMPPIPDIAPVHFSDIKSVLPKPVYPDGFTKRQQSMLTFDFDFTAVKLG